MMKNRWLKMSRFVGVIFILLAGWTGAAYALTLAGPVLPNTEGGWGDFGLLIRAESNVNLVSVRYPNQGAADLIELRDNLTGSLLTSVATPAGNTNVTVLINYPLEAGKTYRLLATTSSNRMWTGYSSWPTGNAAITVLSSFGNGSPQAEYWFSFNDIVTGDAQCTPPPSGMVSWWRAEDDALDFVGANDGTMMNGAAFAAGMVNKAFSFDGVDDYVQVGARPDLVMTSTLSVDAWIYPTGPGSPIHGGIIVNKEGEYEIGRYPDGSIQWAFANTTPGWIWINTGYVAPLNQWTHVAVVYKAGVIKTYANGVLVHTYVGAGSIGDVQPIENDFRIGGRQVGVQYFMGRIDEVEVSNRALSADEIAAIFNAGPAGKCVPVLTVNIDMPTGGTVKGGGINCPAGACSNEYVKGTTVALTATAKNSYRFKNWTGCNIPSGNLCTMLMNKSKTVTANFVGMYSISGKVVDQNGLPMPNVTVTLESVAGGGLPPDFVQIEALAADISRLTVTDAYGKYKFTKLPNGSYKVTPGDVGFTFTPLNQRVTILDGNVPGVNFRLMY